MHIEPDDLSRSDVQGLLREHLAAMPLYSPPGSIHALDLEALRVPAITFWTVREDGVLLACGAMKELDPTHGELKSMRTAAAHLRRGAARRLVAHMIEEARQRGYARLSLETGAHAAFRPAHQLYSSMGFEFCGAFAGYVEDRYSVFMTRRVAPHRGQGQATP